MGDLTWEKYREEDLELSEKEFNDLSRTERANWRSMWRDEVRKQKEHVRKQEEHEARMRQLRANFRHSGDAAAPPKRPRLELSPNVDEALQQVTRFADEFDKLGSRMGDPCIPFEVAETWKEDDLAILLRQKTDACFENVSKQNRSEEENASGASKEENASRASKSPDTQRVALIVAIRAGMGNGKTHALRQAARLLGARGIYITYNGEQGISRDIEGAAKCVLLGIIFALLGAENYGAARFLDNDEMHTHCGQAIARSIFSN